MFLSNLQIYQFHIILTVHQIYYFSSEFSTANSLNVKFSLHAKAPLKLEKNTPNMKNPLLIRFAKVKIIYAKSNKQDIP
jgi:hypothetical protein